MPYSPSYNYGTGQQIPIWNGLHPQYPQFMESQRRSNAYIGEVASGLKKLPEFSSISAIQCFSVSILVTLGVFSFIESVVIKAHPNLGSTMFGAGLGLNGFAFIAGCLFHREDSKCVSCLPSGLLAVSTLGFIANLVAMSVLLGEGSIS